MYNMQFTKPNMNCSSYGMDFTQQALNDALNLIREAVQGERSDELEYDYLISVAPTQEEKDIISSIRNDERNHRQWFKDVYKFYTGEDIEAMPGGEFTRPASYLEGISKAVFGELGAMEKYRFIREGLPERMLRDTALRILTDEMKHATKYNYILNKNALSQKVSAPTQAPAPAPTRSPAPTTAPTTGPAPTRSPGPTTAPTTGTAPR